MTNNNFPELISALEAARRFGVTRQGVGLWVKRFPEIVADNARPRRLRADLIEKIVDARTAFTRLSLS
ncbi:hypothetical protein [Mesorhizobium sp. DCY119]|uniref:hypothetical protein n=1 Tax=Mesorhizobium sp. DCY119 TaxID=2108445 RepID=UPI000E71F551|nr:hypothetical protein [Mesorhizobium sp. DCY119]RJG43717.1 hypothetical protein D3Y55_05220 [Mesorhizobium sp. DCY119]